MRLTSRLSAVAALALAVACARAGRAPAPAAPTSSATPASATPMVASVSGASAAAVVDGRAVFAQVCAACHSVQPPPVKAPPMSHVARHYRDRFTTESASVAAIVAWVRAPSAERSVLPAHARERFGVMPPLALPDAQLHAVARYVWTLGDGATGMGGRCAMGGHQGGACCCSDTTAGMAGGAHHHGPPPPR